MRTPHGLMWTRPTEFQKPPEFLRTTGSTRLRSGDPKLPAEAVVTILASNEPQRVLAQKYGVCQQTISKVKRRLTYTKFGKTPGEIEYESWGIK